MSSDCSHDCGNCSQTCSQNNSDKKSFLAKAHKDSNVKKVIAIISGKGGVGKSMVTGLLSDTAVQQGKKVGILDADITGPSIPKMFGVHNLAKVDEEAVYPEEAKNGIKIMSINLLLESETDPVIWRGPVIANTVSQFWTEVAWGDLDYLFVDMPPGTGDVPLTVFQSLPVDGIIVVTSPQDLVSMIVEKAVNMAKQMDIPILGIVENMSYFICPNCDAKHYIYGQSNIDAIAENFGISNVAKLAIDMNRAALCDQGKAEDLQSGELQSEEIERVFLAIDKAVNF